MEAGVGLRTGPHVQQPALPMHRHKYAAEDVSVQLLRMVGNTVKVIANDYICLSNIWLAVVIIIMQYCNIIL